MNCSRCQAPLEEGARFCRNCGLPVPAADYAAPVASNPASGQPLSQPYAPTQPFTPASPAMPAAPLPYTQPVGGAAPVNQQFGQNQPGQFVQQAPAGPVKRKRHRLRGTIITLLVLIVLVVGGWFVVARPILHNYAQGQIDQVVTSNINSIVPVPINSLVATEQTIDNLIVLNSSSGPVTNAAVHISPPVFASDGTYTGGMQLDFNIFGFPCSVIAIPKASNGFIVVTHLQVNGVIAWVMSAQELTDDLNSHLHAVNGRLLRSISSVTLKTGEIDVTLA
ncbi:MAG TPA: zinc ribbon domain-containing protein [Ktedonobacteraceae bacterium]|nr:zinc ribbon domain-containing protein [Ktedonobacteraceae bacterium]